MGRRHRRPTGSAIFWRQEFLAGGNVILAEVLQGFTPERDFEDARRMLTLLTVIEIVGPDIAIDAARNLRTFRIHGVTVRKMIDVLIATRCILDRHRLLYSDRDFDPFVRHLGLTSTMEDM